MCMPPSQAAASRAETWSALEEARAAGKCRFIGVSNYSVPLLAEMEAYANVMPAVNQGPDSIGENPGKLHAKKLE